MKLRTLSILGLAAVLCASCSQEKENTGLGRGSFSLSLVPDYDVIPVLRSSGDDAADTPSPDEFAIRLTREDGSFSHEWNSIADIPADATFETGNYTLYAYYGDVDTEGFDTPFYAGETDFSIRDGETTPVEVTCTLGQVKISIEYSETFRNYFTDYATTVRSEGGKSIVFDKEETRPAYLRPGNISLQVALTKPNGISATYEPAQITNALPRRHYIITFDVSESVGAAVVTITFDDATEIEPVTIDISDEAMTAPAPYFTTDGFTSGETLELQECEATASTVGTMISARGGLAGCTLFTQSAFLQSQGFPAEMELTDLSPEEQAAIERMGLTIRGFGDSNAKMAYVDFTGMLPHLQISADGNADHTFTLSARDINGKVSDQPLTLTIHNTPLQVELAASACMLGDEQARFTLLCNGKDISKVQLLALQPSGEWSSLPYSVESQSGTSYNLLASLPAGNTLRTFKAVYNGIRESEQCLLTVTVPSFRLTAADGDVWSNRASLQVVADNPQYQDVIEQYIILYINNGGEWEKASYTTSGNRYEITGLQAGIDYNIKGSCLSDLSDLDAATPLTIHTEAAASLPNASFEDWTSWFSRTVNKGGRYGKIAGWQQETVTIESSQPNGWATVNTKTVPTSPQTENSWYMVPSTLPATGNTGTCALLRNVAWDNDGSTPPQGLWGVTNNQSLSHLTPPSINNRSAGKIFLGEYSYDHASGSETYNEGISFTSRPGKLTGYYKYTAVGNDANGTVTVTVEHRDSDGSITTLATQEVALTPSAAFTPFEVPLTYTNTSLKATHLKVMFASSDHASYSQAEESSQISTTDNRSEAVSLGSELYIDDLSLVY